VTARTRIVLADDHPIVLNGLRKPGRRGTGISTLVGEASRGLAALKMIRDQRPDVAVVDISMPELNGIVLRPPLGRRSPLRAPVLMLTLHEDRALPEASHGSGRSGAMFLKRSAAEKSGAGYPSRRGSVGFTSIPADFPAAFFPPGPGGSKTRSGAFVDAPALTERESEVLKLVALGFTNKRDRAPARRQRQID